MTFRAGAASVPLEPPLGLPMVGFVRRHEPASSSLGDLEIGALVLERDGTVAVVVALDILGMQSPEVDELRRAVAAAVGATPSAVLLNFNHTHCAPPAAPSLAGLGGRMDGVLDPRLADFQETVRARTLDAVRLAASRREEAGVAWGLGRCDAGVNRRERLPDGRVILGWHPEGLVDPQVPVLQVRRRDDSVVATVVTYGCHTVSVGPDVLAYSADYAGPMRTAVRDWTGGECLFLQGAGGNILPRVAFARDVEPSRRMGRELALAALAAMTDRPAWRIRHERRNDGSVTPFHLYRPVVEPGDPPALAATERRVRLPLLALPGVDEVVAARTAAERAVAEAERAGADPAGVNVLRYQVRWAQAAEAALRDGRAPTVVEGSVHALRIGDGAIVTGPGEIFCEIGLAVRERSPAQVTAYTGYTNGMISYFPAASEYRWGGYEPAYGNKSFGLPAQVAPECDELLVDAGLDALDDVFPERPAERGTDRLATGALPEPPARVLPTHPDREGSMPPGPREGVPVLASRSRAREAAG